MEIVQQMMILNLKPQKRDLDIQNQLTCVQISNDKTKNCRYQVSEMKKSKVA